MFSLSLSVSLCLSLSLSLSLSPSPPDPSLTLANLLHVTRHIPLWGRQGSYLYLDMPRCQHDEIVRTFDGEKAKQQLFTMWLASHPCPSWEQVMGLLRGDEGYGGVGGEEGRRAADEVKETYLKSELDTVW